MINNLERGRYPNFLQNTYRVFRGIHNPTKAFSFVEMLITMALAALLLTLVNGITYSTSDYSRRIIELSTTARKLEFFVELMRKELGELHRETGNPAFDFLGGEGMLSYSTSRLEFIARNDTPAGYLRIEWIHDPEKKVLERSVTPVVTDTRQAGKTTVTKILENVEKVEFSIFDGKKWFPLTGSLAPIDIANAVGVDIYFVKASSPVFGNAFSTAFLLPK
ncbi:MAG: prepilin-type N-terminal cleavage/methylation domain-containing protein [Candidatus Riflebacteria bacterium]|nr:prepilin-type N-terminal cleavage/methylation domain-containing protein [Candidatus Riflebacteria bacterium]